MPVGEWVVPAGGAPIAASALYARAARQSVVLLGERHDSAEDHRWQLHMLAVLHAQRPDLVIALEMFPRRVQPVLDRWTRGELTEAEFLAASEWRTVWNFDPALYMPIFDFARMHRLPMVAANVDRALVSDVARRGLEAVPADRREGVGRAARAARALREWRWPTSTPSTCPPTSAAEARRSPTRSSGASSRRRRCGTAPWPRPSPASLKRRPQALVVGIMGRGHVEHGDGVAHQLRDLGVADVMLLMPWDRDMVCKDLVPGIADAVFGVAHAQSGGRRRRGRVSGVSLETTADGVRILRVDKDSIAAASGLRDGDVFVDVAGRPVKQFSDVADAVRRQAPGTWLPIVVRRGGETRRDRRALSGRLRMRLPRVLLPLLPALSRPQRPPRARRRGTTSTCASTWTRARSPRAAR